MNANERPGLTFEWDHGGKHRNLLYFTLHYNRLRSNTECEKYKTEKQDGAIFFSFEIIIKHISLVAGELLIRIK